MVIWWRLLRIRFLSFVLAWKHHFLFGVKVEVGAFIYTARIVGSISINCSLNFPAGNSPNLGVSHHFEVIRTGAPTFQKGWQEPFLHLGAVRLWFTLWKNFGLQRGRRDRWLFGDRDSLCKREKIIWVFSTNFHIIVYRSGNLD